MDTITTKQCSNCGQVLPVSEFYKDKRAKSGYRSRCKKCHLRYERNYCQKQQAKLYQRKYYAEHAEYYARWREEHREETRVKARQRYHVITAGNKDEPQPNA